MKPKRTRRGTAAPSLAWAPLQAFVIFGFVAVVWAILA